MPQVLGVDSTTGYLPTVRLQNGLNVLDAVARLLGVDRSRFDQLALAAPLGAGGVTLVPSFAAKRVPPRAEATGLLAGLGPDVHPSRWRGPPSRGSSARCSKRSTRSERPTCRSDRVSR